jgi:hypothetical protein
VRQLYATGYLHNHARMWLASYAVHLRKVHWRAGADWMFGHLLVFAAFLTCLRLGWWQWGRTQETTGTAQNFGYALLWPAFGAAFIYMWVRFLHLEVLKDVEDDEDTERALRQLLDGQLQNEGLSADTSPTSPASGTGSAGPRSAVDPSAEPGTEGVDEDPQHRRRDRLSGSLQKPSQGVTIAVATVSGEDDDDPELTAYNQALAALAEEDRRRAR